MEKNYCSLHIITKREPDYKCTPLLAELYSRSLLINDSLADTRK